MPAVAAVIKPALDENLPPIKNFSLRQWNDKFQHFTTALDLTNRDVFALTGHYTSLRDGQTYRARLDDDACKLADGVIGQACDIDSVLGVVRDHFPVADNIIFKYFMLHHASYTLTANLHIPGIHVINQDLEEEPIQLHKLPNARFAEMGDGFLVRIFFPELRHEQPESLSPNYVGSGHMKTFYNNAVLPAAIEIMPDALVRTWPATFDDEMFRAGNGGGNAGNPGNPGTRRTNPQHSSKDVHAQYLNPWIDVIRRRVTEDHSLEFARGFFFLVEGKGTKNRDGISHSPPQEDLVDDDGNLIDPNNDRTRAVNHLLREFDTALFQPDDWYLDIATTVSGEDEHGHPFCLFASPDSHPEIINYFSGTNIAQCENFVRSNSGGYQKDEVAHTGVFAGFRIPFQDPGDTGVHYLQVYSSEKSITYRVDAANKAKQTSLHNILNDWPAEKKSFFVPLQSALTNASATHSVVLRFESRVRFDCYPLVHHKIPMDHLQPWLRYANNTSFWGFKAKRLIAISNVLNRLIKARESFCLENLPEVGSLLVTLPWMANSLTRRPPDGSHWNEVSDAGSVHVQQGDVVLPDRPLAIYYLHSLRLPPGDVQAMPRVSSHRTVSKATIVYLFQTSKIKQNELGVWKLIRGQPKNSSGPEGDPWEAEGSSASQANRVPKQSNKQRKVNCRLASDVPDVFEDVIPNPQRLRGYESEEEDPEEREAPKSVSQQATDIVHNFPIQIFSKVPNRRGKNESWCTLTPSERMVIGVELFHDRSKPGHIFSCHVDFGYDRERWDKTVQVLFPTRVEHPVLRKKKIQGLDQLTVWLEWEMLLASVDGATAGKLVAEARKLVGKTWKWLPLFGKNHLWPTGVSNVPDTAKYHGPEKAGPWIVRNPRFRL